MMCLQTGEQQPVKACPMCRQPLTQIMRYGRPMNHMKVQHAEMKFFLLCTQELESADHMYNEASAAAAHAERLPGQKSFVL